MFCLVSVLYSVTSFVGILISSPLTNFQKASEKLREHFEGLGKGRARKYHLAAVEVAERFRAVMESKAIPIDQQLWNARAITIAKNKQKLKSIADTVIFCGCRGIALRGHRDDWKHVDEHTPIQVILLPFCILKCRVVIKFLQII